MITSLLEGSPLAPPRFVFAAAGACRGGAAPFFGRRAVSFWERKTYHYQTTTIPLPNNNNTKQHQKKATPPKRHTHVHTPQNKATNRRRAHSLSARACPSFAPFVPTKPPGVVMLFGPPNCECPGHLSDIHFPPQLPLNRRASFNASACERARAARRRRPLGGSHAQKKTTRFFSSLLLGPLLEGGLCLQRFWRTNNVHFFSEVGRRLSLSPFLVFLDPLLCAQSGLQSHARAHAPVPFPTPFNPRARNGRFVRGICPPFARVPFLSFRRLGPSTPSFVRQALYTSATLQTNHNVCSSAARACVCARRPQSLLRTSSFS